MKRLCLVILLTLFLAGCGDEAYRAQLKEEWARPRHLDQAYFDNYTPFDIAWLPYLTNKTFEIDLNFNGTHWITDAPDGIYRCKTIDGKYSCMKWRGNYDTEENR